MIHTVKDLDIHQWAERAEAAEIERDAARRMLSEHAAMRETAYRARDAAEVERDKIRDAASWLLANRGHRGEEQAWKLLQDALGDSE